ncbi:Pentatricopeptide repeat-containing protein [Apostasia shenzhenica]|uniref:Pentatricopeptide repeat-containing protein n=1 Tax=Apostasia shenzhenica TaxID=1088818 RepID=A0A2I0BB92_9ASPA|nr:Pentatricopeptide repeat-containing protein [Apostasia shenzhenica]
MLRALQNLRRLHALYTTREAKSLTEWAQIIRSYLSHGFSREALILYAKNPIFRTQHLLLPLILKAIACHSLLQLGESLHAESIKAGTVDKPFTGTSFISLYARCHEPILARKVFDEMPVRNPVAYNAMIGGYWKNGNMQSACDLFDSASERTPITWTVMIEGYAESGDLAAARRIFDSMPSRMRTVVTWTVMVEGYAAIEEMYAAREMFDEMPMRNAYVWSSMINGYFKKGEVGEARAMFDRIPSPNLVNWNSLIAGYAKIGFCHEALGAFRRMQESGTEPDEYTVASLLSACAQMGSLDSGREIHKLIRKKKIRMNSFVLNGLVDVYAKCGDLENAQKIFNGMIARNNSCWNSMLSGLASHGQSGEALELFSQMEESDQVKPNSITFLVMLVACTHGGFVEEGLEIFKKMGSYGLEAGVEHYGCLVDLLGRAGRLAEAFELIKIMPMKPNEVVLGALLGACRVHSDKAMADQVVTEAGSVNSRSSSVNDVDCVLLSNINAASEKWELAEKMRRKMVEDRVTKSAGFSSFERLLVRIKSFHGWPTSMGCRQAAACVHAMELSGPTADVATAVEFLLSFMGGWPGCAYAEWKWKGVNHGELCWRCTSKPLHRVGEDGEGRIRVRQKRD